MTWQIAILTFVTLQRLSELVIAKRNTDRLLAAGGKEYGASHYIFMVLLHGAWLVGLWLLALSQPIIWSLLLVYAVLQVFRVWILTTLGRRWTTKIIVVPGEILVAHGPYRFMSHPNYVLVVAEIACLPAVFGLWLFAVIFSILNAIVLFVRIRAENAALADVR